MVYSIFCPFRKWRRDKLRAHLKGQTGYRLLSDRHYQRDGYDDFSVSAVFVCFARYARGHSLFQSQNKLNIKCREQFRTTGGRGSQHKNDMNKTCELDMTLK